MPINPAGFLYVISQPNFTTATPRSQTQTRWYPPAQTPSRTVPCNGDGSANKIQTTSEYRSHMQPALYVWLVGCNSCTFSTNRTGFSCHMVLGSVYRNTEPISDILKYRYRHLRRFGICKPPGTENFITERVHIICKLNLYNII